MGDASDTQRDTDGATNDEENFLQRWSRRKQTGNPPAPAPAGSTDRESVSAMEEEAAPPTLTDADMPPLESLDSDSDYSMFMSPGVSEQLRTQALHKLFHLPAFNVTDGLNDYDEDYTRFAGLGDVVTQEMKRMLKRRLEAKDEPQLPVDEDADLVADAETDKDRDEIDGDEIL